jgi:hypothetical protein
MRPLGASLVDGRLSMAASVCCHEAFYTVGVIMGTFQSYLKIFCFICLIIFYKKKNNNQKMNPPLFRKKLTRIFIPTLTIASQTTGTGGLGATA